MPRLGLPAGPARSGSSLAPAQRQSIGSELINRGKGALGTALGALDYPGSLVRGAMAGSPGDSMTGRQMLNRWGVTRPGDRGWGSWGAGLAADIATDPFTYLTFGAKHALTTGGRALQNAGHLQGWGRKALLEGFHDTESALHARGVGADAIAHLRDQGKRIASPAVESAYQGAAGQALRPGVGLSGLARASVPFAPRLGVTFGSGRMAQGVAGGLDRTADFVRFGNPIGRAVNGLFDYRVGRATDAASQRAISSTVDARKALEAEARTHEYDTLSGLDKLIRDNPGHESNILRAARINVEGVSPLAFLGSAKDPAERAAFQGFLHATKPLGDTIAGYGRDQFTAGQRAGLLTRNSADKFARYVSRQSTAADLAEAGPQFERRTILPTTSGSNIHREEVFRNLPGGTDRINDWANRFAGSRDTNAVASGILSDIAADHAHVLGVAPTPQEFLEYELKAKALADRIGELDPNKYLGRIGDHPFYSHDLAGDVARRGSQHARTMASSQAIIKALGSTARGVGEFKPGDQYLLLPQALKKLRLGNHDLGSEMVGAGPELYRALAPKGAGMVQPLTQGGAPYALNRELAQWAIPKDQFDQLAKSYGNWITPEEAIRPIRAVDSLTNAFKALAYPIWMASHVRNAATATLNNARTATALRDYASQYKLMRGLSPEAVADAARRTQYGHARIFGEGGPNLELAGPISGATAAPSYRRWSGLTPGTNVHGMGQAGPTGSFVGDTANLLANEGLAQFVRDAWNKVRNPRTAPSPFALSGVFGNSTDRFAPVVAGRKLGSNIENFFRGAQYQGLIRQGYSPEMAARQIDRFHFNYQDLTPFEKHWMRRAVPFYTFTRKNLPLQMETLATRPGAFSTPFKPAMVDRDKQEYTPEYLANGFVTPLGPEQNGSRRFLSSLGLPQEEALKEIALWDGKPDILTTLMHYAGNLNPLIKGPLEQIADRQFYSGRRLSDLRPSSAAKSLLGGLASDEYAQPLSQFISNSPLTRFATSLDKLLDTRGIASNGRKPGWATALNLLTGARVTDVDLDAQKYFEQRNALERMLKGQPHVSRYQEFYVRPENKKLLTPEESLELSMLADMQQRAKAHTERQRRLGRQQ
jgi:hypothetical protein